MVKTIGLVEKVTINGKEILAKIDTGAERNSVDIKLAAKLSLGPIIDVKNYISSHGTSTRVIIKGSLNIKGKKIRASFNLFDRKTLKYKVLIGKKTLKSCGFLIDPRK